MNLLLAEVAQATQRLADSRRAFPALRRGGARRLRARRQAGELHTVADADFDARYWEAVARREAREPLQHITGRAFFRYLELQVGPGVFVPRPETESVVGWAIDAVRAMDVVEPLIVDLCTGSGAIALALAQEVPRSRVHAVELDESALGWARKNVEGSRVQLHHGNALTALPELDGQVDLVISNPPYIPLTEWEYVAPRGPRPRPRARALLRRGRPRHHPRPGAHRPPAAAPRRRRRHRARRHPGRPGAVDLHRGAGLGRRGRPP
ncbi:hypothetical protein GCM10020000_25830 [Streptomyces olivoverticillatus]